MRRNSLETGSDTPACIHTDLIRRRMSGDSTCRASRLYREYDFPLGMSLG